MAARGYTTAEFVEEEVGRDLTPAQYNQVSRLIAQAEDICDRVTGRSWLAPSPTVNELHTVMGPLVYLEHKPVTAITSMTRRILSLGSAVVAMVAGTDYELVDATNGIVLMSRYPWADVVINTTTTDYGTLVAVSYTSVTPVPGGIQRAATQLVAHWMTKRLNASHQGIRSYSVGGDLSVTYADQSDLPDKILQALRGYRVMTFA